MNTNWLSPSSITFIPDSTNTNSAWTDWRNDAVNLLFAIQTKKHLRKISIHDIATTIIFSDTLVLSRFNIPSYNTLLGIKVMLDIHRQARITDYVVQMHMNGVAYSTNLAVQEGGLSNITYYGSSTELWGIAPGTNIATDNFGLLVQLGPHPHYPGNDEAIVNNIKIQVYYS